MVRKHLRHSTFYRMQVIQLRYLTSLAAAEANRKNGTVTRRYVVRVVCNSPCEHEDKVVKGAVNAIAWLVQHNRHKTYVKGTAIHVTATHSEPEDR